MSLILSGTDGLSDVDGSAATPAIRGTDANTGMFFPAADTIAFSEGGVESMRLNSSGVLVTTNDASISGLTVGKGSGSQSSNAVFGSGALAVNTTGNDITAVGTSSLAANTTGIYNTAFGSNSLASNTIGDANSAFGRYSVQGNTSGGGLAGFGANALRANTTGNNNTALGTDSLRFNTTASNNTAVGYQAGYSNTTGTDLVAIGYQAGYNSTGSRNTFIGRDAGRAVTTGTDNTFVGRVAGTAVTTGSGNTFIGVASGGAGAGETVTTGSKNTILGGYTGNQGGLDIRTLSNYIVLSDGDGNPRGYFNNNGLFVIANAVTNSPKIYFESQTTSYASDHIQSLSFTAAGTGWNHFIGYSNIGGTTNIKIQGNGNIQNANNSYGALSDIRLKENIVDATPKLEKLMQVRVRNYNLKGDYEKHKQLGVIAQELESVFPAMVDETIDKDKDGNELGTTTKSVKYSVFIPMLIKAIQELKAEVDSLKAQLNK